MCPTVSVVIPTFNRAAWLPDAIVSVLAQSFEDFELIVVDDGSTDATREVVAAVDDRRLRYVYQENAGISAAMNTGLARARGRYVARLDSDDLWMPDFLETQVAALEAHPEAGLVYGKAEVVAAEDRPSETRGAPMRSAGDTWRGRLSQLLAAGDDRRSETRGAPLRYAGDSWRSMVWGDATCSVTLLARRECLEQVGGFDESLATSEDWDVCLRVARHHELVFVDRVLARMRRHGGNITTGASAERVAEVEGRVRVLDKLFAEPGLPPRIERMRGVAYANVHTENALYWLAERSCRRALRCAGRAVRSSGEPLYTIARLLWFAAFDTAPGRSAAGQVFKRWVSELRHRRRRTRVVRSRRQ